MTENSKRRDFLKMAALGGAAGTFAGLANPPALAADNASKSGSEQGEIKVAGYDYDRVRGIMDGKTGIPGRKVSFHTSIMTFVTIR